MKRYIYILLASIALWGCAESDLDSENIDGGISNGDGTVTLAFDLKLSNSTITAVSTRASDKENVTKISGWAFVFDGTNLDDDGSISDNSQLLQKVAFKTTGDDSDNQTVYVTLDEQTGACFIRLMTSMTDHTSEQINAFVSKKMYDADPTSYSEAEITTFDDYKHIDVTLLGYYQSADEPDPNALTENLAFPLASPGVSMPDISEESVADADLNLYMVPVASKLDVTVDDNCDFKLHEVTLLNGAKKALMRSTVLKNDGVSVLDFNPLPTNLGGVVEFAPVLADEDYTTTEATPIYFYPNEGDYPQVYGYDGEDVENLSDPINGHNPTYLIIKGCAEGYEVDGYYKIAIRYNPLTDSSYDDQSTFNDIDTYDIIRDNHYKVYLTKVDNPGYATKEEAIAGVANNISFDIEVETNNDSRNETIVSDSGLYSMELNTSSVYVRSYIYDGETLDLDMSFWLDGNEEAFQDTDDVESDDYYSAQKAYITCSDGLTINSLTLGGEKTEISSDGSFAVDWESGYSLNFSLTSATSETDTITIRYGNIAKEIPVYFENSRISMFSDSAITVNDDDVFTTASFEAVGEISYYDDAADQTFAAFFSSTSGGSIEQYPDITTTLVDMDNFDGRTFNGYIYPSDMSGGVIRLYCHQGSLPFHLAYELNDDPDTALDPYYMVDYQDFDHLATSVNGTNCTAKTFSGNDFKMLQDVDLQSKDNAREHTAIGRYGVTSLTTSGSTVSGYMCFSGTFDGGNYTVSNIDIYNDENDTSTGCGMYLGLFGLIDGATIKNLTVDGSITGIGYIGGLVGCVSDLMTSTSSTIDNCTNKASVKTIYYFSSLGSHYVGGLVGGAKTEKVLTQVLDISNCTNYGEITGHDEVNYIGGIIGGTPTSLNTYKTSIKAEKCYNKAKVTGDQYVGGIVGYAYDSDISNCDNSAAVEAGNFVGGMVGYAYGSSSNSITVMSCTNTGAVKGSQYVGGVAGHATYGYFDDCGNAGSVESTLAYSSSTYAYAGGIAGIATYATIKNCTNGVKSTENEDNSTKGAVKGSAMRVAGIVGSTTDETASTGACSITSCYNYADVEGYSYVGGMVGYGHTSTTTTLTVNGCTNEGDVAATTGGYVGGMVGYAYYTATIENKCTNSGAISGTQYIGGMVGSNDSGSYPLAITDATNSGAVTGSSTYTYVGGIAGYALGSSTSDSKFTSCTNTGAIKGSRYVSGVAGYAYYGYLDECSNTGSVTSTYESTSSYAYAGGIVGYASYTTLSGCKNLKGDDQAEDEAAKTGGVVTAGAPCAGGIAGYAYYRCSISYCDNSAAVEAYNFVGGIVGYLYASSSNKTYISNCTNSGSMQSRIVGSTTDYSYSRTGGIVGNCSNGEVSDCTNYATISGTGLAVGGIIGISSNTVVLDCTNDGAVYGTHASVGGIIGYLMSGTTTRNCRNNALISCENTSTCGGLGGVVGYVHTSSGTITIDNCENYGTVGYQTSTNGTGGIVGYLYRTGNSGFCYVTNCVNYGEITPYNGSSTSIEYIGGVIGYICAYYHTVEITNCTNNVDIESTSSYVGGVIGLTTNITTSTTYSSSLNISKCTNANAVTGSSYVGGVVGFVGYGTIANCFNTGAVTATSNYAGGIASALNTTTITAYPHIINCYNMSKVSGSSYVGGVTGRSHNTSSIIANSYNTATVSGSSNYDLIIGSNLGTVSDCYYLSTLGSSNHGDGKSETYMKALYTTLNNNLANYSSYGCELSTWVEDTEGINDGFPIFDWQVSSSSDE